MLCHGQVLSNSAAARRMGGGRACQQICRVSQNGKKHGGLQGSAEKVLRNAVMMKLFVSVFKFSCLCFRGVEFNLSPVARIFLNKQKNLFI